MKTKRTSAAAGPVSLKNLREARNVTQEGIAKLLKIRQASVAKFERRDNPRFSSILSVIKAMGGKVRMTVSFADGMEKELTFEGKAVKAK
ncbi:MAG: helix-turn-helix transcriptional regulator [Planctomycetota bacterium]